MNHNKTGNKLHLIGFSLSLLLTLLSYYIVRYSLFSRGSTITWIVSLAIIQLWAQLFFFLHLGRAPKLYWNRMALFFMLLVLIIIVGGSLWIMDNLNSNVMPSM
ncbi:MAG: cytochrome o ubiquinol oxidase subunit IV [Chlamydia sp.]